MQHYIWSFNIWQCCDFHFHSEECPYCGKPFKRLKSHLPHCKKAPVAQPLKSTQTPKDLPKKNAITPKQKTNKKILAEKNDLVFDERQTSKDRRKEDKLNINKKSVHNAESSEATTEVTSLVNTDRPKSKWSAKRQKEHERSQQLAVLQKSINSTSISHYEGDKSFCKMSNGQEKGASETNGKTTKARNKLKVAPIFEHLSKSTTTAPTIHKSTNLSSEWILRHESPKFTATEPNSQSSDINLVSKEVKALTFFTSKTSVWDHIKGSLYYKRSCNLLHKAPFETKDISVTTQLSKNPETTKPSTPAIHLSETIQRPVENVHSSRLQSVRSLGWNPEIMTSFRILISTEPFRNSSNDNMWKKHQSSHSEGDAWFLKYVMSYKQIWNNRNQFNRLESCNLRMTTTFFNRQVNHHSSKHCKWDYQTVNWMWTIFHNLRFTFGYHETIMYSPQDGSDWATVHLHQLKRATGPLEVREYMWNSFIISLTIFTSFLHDLIPIVVVESSSHFQLINKN